LKYRFARKLNISFQDNEAEDDFPLRQG